MFKYKEREIFLGKSWTDDEGIQHPSNWNIWSDEEKEKRGVIEIITDTPPDDRFYIWSMDSNGKITSIPKDLNDSGSGKDREFGLKSVLIKKINTRLSNLLYLTDWYYVRHYDTGVEVPTNIQTWRDACRARAVKMEEDVNACSTIEDVIKLWEIKEIIPSSRSGKDVTKITFLDDFPKLEE